MRFQPHQWSEPELISQVTDREIPTQWHVKLPAKSVDIKVKALNPNLSFYNPKSSVHWVLLHDMVNPAAARSPPTHWKWFLGEQRMTVIYLILRKCIVIKQFFPKTFVVRIYHESCVLSAVIYLHDVPTLFFFLLAFLYQI